MTNLELLVEIARMPGDVGDLTRQVIGNDVLAILLAKAALSNTSEELSASRLHDVLKIARSTAQDWIDTISLKEAPIKS